MRKTILVLLAGLFAGSCAATPKEMFEKTNAVNREAATTCASRATAVSRRICFDGYQRPIWEKRAPEWVGYYNAYNEMQMNAARKLDAKVITRDQWAAEDRYAAGYLTDMVNGAYSEKVAYYDARDKENAAILGILMGVAAGSYAAQSARQASRSTATSATEPTPVMTNYRIYDCSRSGTMVTCRGR